MVNVPKNVIGDVPTSDNTNTLHDLMKDFHGTIHFN